jgi:hypothetical protein
MVAQVSRTVATFRALPWSNGTLARFDDAHPTIVRAVVNSELALPEGETHYVYAVDGAELDLPRGAFSLTAGMFASVPDACSIRGSALIVSRVDHRGVFLLGGPIERYGRLRYIDGCTDSLLLPPAVCGDPCLNHLHIPPFTRQTEHTHPSLRVGIIVRGRGRCVTPAGEHRLSAGLAFVIEPDLLHSFHTDDDSLDVVVYHPDTDTGPTHEDHPMKNRTILP